MKKALFFLAMISIIGVSMLAAGGGKKIKLGVIQLRIDHPDHILLRKSFVEELEKKGYEVEATVFNANSDKYPVEYCSRAAAEARRMQDEGYDLIYCTATYHCMKDENLTVPVIDGVFISPIILGYAEERDGAKYCKGNATGSIFGYAFKDVVEMAKKIKPDAKKIGYVYNPASPISRPMAELEEEAKKVGLQVIGYPFADSKEGLQAIRKAADEVDISFGTNDMAVVGFEMEGLKLAGSTNHPMIVAIVPNVHHGAIAAIQWDWARAGVMCAEKADKIMNGTPANSIPITYPDQVEIGVNLKEANRLGLKIPQELIDKAVLKVE